MKCIIVNTLLVMSIFMGFSSCKKEASQNPTTPSSNSIVGKWSFPSDSQGSYLGYWTFNSDGTMLVEDKGDLFNGVTTTYSYNADSKKLTVGGGLIVRQLIWISSNQFKYEGNGTSTAERTFTKVP